MRAYFDSAPPALLVELAECARREERIEEASLESSVR